MLINILPAGSDVSAPSARLVRPAPPRQPNAPLRAEAHCRIAFLTPEGRLALDSEGAAPPASIEGLDADTLRRASARGEAILRPGVDDLGRTLIATYLPATLSPTGETKAPAVYLASLALLGEAVHYIARQRYGMTRLAARVCAALVETGSLRRASRECGVTYQTAQSEMADAMHAADVRSQSALICRLAEDWLPAPLEAANTVELLVRTFELKPRDARIAIRLAAGHSRAEAGERLGLSKWAVKSSCTRLFTTLGVAKAPELTRVVIDLLLSADLAERRPHAQGGYG